MCTVFELPPTCWIHFEVYGQRRCLRLFRLCTVHQKRSCVPRCLALSLRRTAAPTSGVGECSAADELRVSARKTQGKGKGGDAGEYVYTTAERTTEPLLFLRGCCRNVKRGIGKKFLRGALFWWKLLFGTSQLAAVDLCGQFGRLQFTVQDVPLWNLLPWM